MQIVYSLDMKTKEVKLYEIVSNEKSQEALDKTALKVLIFEEGQRRAKIMEGNGIDYESQEPGYFLKRDGKKIILYNKVQQISHGWIGSTIQFEIKCIKLFGLTNFIDQEIDLSVNESKENDQIILLLNKRVMTSLTDSIFQV